jgi:hypothetical protein
VNEKSQDNERKNIFQGMKERKDIRNEKRGEKIAKKHRETER